MKQKKDLSTELEEFLEYWNADSMTSFLREVIPLFALFDIEDENDWVANEVGKDNAQNVRIIRSAYLISRIAYLHAGKLCEIKIKFKDLWKRIEKDAENV